MQRSMIEVFKTKRYKAKDDKVFYILWFDVKIISIINLFLADP